MRTSTRTKRAQRQQGIEARNKGGCANRRGAECDCSPSYRAVVFDGREPREIQKTFATLAAAVIWREDSQVDLRYGLIAAAKPATVAEAAEAWMDGAGEEHLVAQQPAVAESVAARTAADELVGVAQNDPMARAVPPQPPALRASRLVKVTASGSQAGSPERILRAEKMSSFAPFLTLILSARA